MQPINGSHAHFSTKPSKAATSRTPSGEVASRCNPRHKGACKPNSSKDSVSGAQISALAMVCVGAARNPWTCQDVGIELSRITPIRVVHQGVTDASSCQLSQCLGKSVNDLSPASHTSGSLVNTKKNTNHSWLSELR